MKIIKSFKKNQIAIYILAIMLVAVGYLNYSSGEKSLEATADPEITYNESISEIGDATLVSSTDIEKESQKNNEPDDYFSKSKLERENMYSQMLETYQNILNSNTTSEEQKSLATQEITNINNTKNAIMICENLLEIKGLEKSIIFVNGNNVSIVVKAEGKLAANQVAQIQNIVAREMKIDVANINITEKNK